jgi:hypothetical protein
MSIINSSGSYSFNDTVQQLIYDAFYLMNIYDPTQAPRTEDYNFAVRLLNIMIKSWEAQDLPIWTRKQATLFTSLGTYQYPLSGTSNNCANSYFSTAISTAASNGATAITVTSNSGVNINDNVGIQLDSGVRQWTTVASLSGSTVINLNAALSTTSAIGNTVITYTTALPDRPLKIINARRINLQTGGVVSWIQSLSYDQYFNIANRSLQGSPVNFYYDKQLNTGQFYIYPGTQNVAELVEFTYQEQLQDVVNPTENAEFPQEWLECLTFNLAVRLGFWKMKYQELQQFQPYAEMLFEKMYLFDSDDTKLKIGFKR